MMFWHALHGVLHIVTLERRAELDEVRQLKNDA